MHVPYLSACTYVLEFFLSYMHACTLTYTHTAGLQYWLLSGAQTLYQCLNCKWMYHIMYVYNNYVHAATFVLELLSHTHPGVNVIHRCLVLRTCLEYYHRQYFIIVYFMTGSCSWGREEWLAWPGDDGSRVERGWSKSISSSLHEILCIVFSFHYWIL